MDSIRRVQENYPIGQQSMTSPSPRTAAVIVLYFPEWDVLSTLLRSLSNQVSKVYLISNGLQIEIHALLRLQGGYAKILVLENNPGLGAALNQGMQFAVQDGCDYLFLFDQDSLAPPNFVSSMLREYGKVQGGFNKIAALGPSFFDLRSSELELNQFKRNGFAVWPKVGDRLPIECDCIITSGMMINLGGLSPIQYFDESYFVDQVDSEWCFRMRSLGFRIYGTTKVLLGHRLSDSAGLRVGSITFLRYNSIRRYWFYKNSIRLIKSPITALIWKLRLSLNLLISFAPNVFLDQNAKQSCKMMLKGLWDGILAR